MTTPATPAPLPAEAVEAVAKLHHRMHCTGGPCQEAGEPCNGDPDELDKAAARQLLEAAAPHLAAAARQLLEAAAPHLAAAEWEHIAVPWRTGRRNGHTIYAQTGPQPSGDDPFIGSLNTPEAAAEAVRAHNAGHDAAAEVPKVIVEVENGTLTKDAWNKLCERITAFRDQLVAEAVAAERELCAQLLQDEADQRSQRGLHGWAVEIRKLADLLRQGGEGGGT